MRGVLWSLVIGVTFGSGVLFAEDSDWTRSDFMKLWPGVVYATANRGGENPIAAYLIRVDVTRKNFSFVTTPPNGDYEVNKSETVRQTAVDFLTENRLTIAVNGNFYNPFNAETQRNPGPSNLIGLAISQGETISPSEPGFPVFTVTAGNECEIREANEGETFDGIQTAVAGNQIVLRDGAIVETENKDVHPRTAIGISADKKYVFFLVIDGRQKGYSVGATYAETAELLRDFGASDGLNLDGGGSTTMVLAENPKIHKKKGEWAYRVVNRPVGQSNQPGTLRYNGNHIGVLMK